MSRIMERVGLGLLAIALVAYLALLLDASMADARAGVMILAILGGFILLFAQAIKDRVGNKEDDYYSQNVEK